MKIIIIACAIIFLLLLWNVKVIFKIKLNNFDFSAMVKLKFPFEKEIFNSKSIGKKSQKSGENNKKQSRKIDMDTLCELKEPATDLITEVCRIVKRCCRIKKVDTMAMLALDDPMSNGVAYGIVSGSLNIITAILYNEFNAKKVSLDIRSDFESGEGFIFETGGTINVRPVMAALLVLFNYKLIKGLKKTAEILKLEEKENG